MKNPFAILIAGAVVIGILITVVVVLLLGSSDDESDGSIQVASQSELPTPSTRNENLGREDARASAGGGATEPTEAPTSDPDVEQTSTQPTETPTEAPQTSNSENGQAAQGGGGVGGRGPGGGQFQAIQEAMADNPELAELFEKAQAGTITQEEQEQMRELVQTFLAEAGIEAPGGGQGGGFGAPPIQGTISSIVGATLTIEHSDESGLSTDIEISDDTNITVVNELTPADLTEGANVAGTVQRGDGGRIYILNLTVIAQQEGQGQGAFGGGFRGAFGETDNDATNVSNINGTVAEINDQTISVETTQGTLRLTANDESNIIATTSGTATDITEGMAVIAFGGNPDDTPIRPSNLIVGSEALLEQGGIPGVRGQGGARRDP